MSKVDDELTRRLRRAERPLEADGVFEGLARRRSHRGRVRRVQGGLLAFAVLTATAGGFVFLREAFDADQRSAGDEPTPSPVANGEIVFSRPLPDGSEHLFVTRGQGGERRITPVGQATYREPSISPDGQTILVSHSIPSFEGEQGYASVIATVPIEGGAPTWLTDPVGIVQDPEWSPDGTKIAFAGAVPGAGRPGIHVMNADGSDVRLLVGSDSFDVLSPDWSPDGSRIVFTGWNDGVTEPDLFSIALDGSDLTNLTDTPEVDEEAPAWSPDGSLIAFISRPVGSSEGTIDLITADGTPDGRVPEIGDAVVVYELDWSPDGRFIAFLSDLAVTDSDTDGDLDVWTVRPNGTELTNLTTEGASGISWQPLPADVVTLTPEPSPEPSTSPEDERVMVEIGLPYRLCDATRLDGIDWLGDGTHGTAWVGTRALPDGSCPDGSDDGYGVAADFQGDGVADSWSGETIEHCLGCEPFEAVDLNGDGRDELIVVLQYFSIMQYGVYTTLPVDGTTEVVAFRTGGPGHPQHALPEGEPFTFRVGGDAGSRDWLWCENLPELRLTGTFSQVDGAPDAETTIHETHVSLGRDGIAHILDAETFVVVGEVDLQYATSKPDCGLGVDVQR
ncbi:MAG: PD40 domain-containing protein [Actinobacteria bacterium]|nr:PD40 domain-containing protein [Actinomycetota bacterium]